MIIRADCTQLENHSLFLNIINEEYSYLGVYTYAYKRICVLYGFEMNRYFMTFFSDTEKSNFEKKFPLLTIFYEYNNIEEK